MKKYIAIYYHLKSKRTAEFEIYANEKLSISEVISHYEKKEKIKVGETNRFGTKLIEIKNVECDDVEIIKYDYY
jgi:hypothetical protein